MNLTITMKRCKAESKIKLKFTLKHIKRFHPSNGVLAILFIFYSTKQIHGQWNFNPGKPPYIPPSQYSYNDNNEIGDFYSANNNNNFNGYGNQEQPIPNTLNNYLQSFGGVYGTNIRGNVPVNVIDLETVNEISRNVDSNYQEGGGYTKFPNQNMIGVASTGVDPTYGNGNAGNIDYTAVTDSQPYPKNGNAGFIPQQQAGYGRFIDEGNEYGGNGGGNFGSNINGYVRGMPYQSSHVDANNFYGGMTNAVDNGVDDTNANGCYNNMDCSPTATTSERSYGSNVGSVINNGVMPNVIDLNGVVQNSNLMSANGNNDYYGKMENQLPNGNYGGFGGESKAMTFVPSVGGYGPIENENENSLIKNSVGGAYGTNYGRNIFDYANNPVNNVAYGNQRSNKGYINNGIGNGDDYYDIPNEFESNGNINSNPNEKSIGNGGFNPQNMKKYAEYLELINKKYGIGMPGDGFENSAVNNGNINQNAISDINSKNTVIGNGGVGITDLQSTNTAITANSGLPDTTRNNGNNNSGYGNNNNGAIGNSNTEITPGGSNSINTGSISPTANTEECEKNTITDSGGLQQNSNSGYGSLQRIEFGQPSYLSVGNGGYQSNSAYGGNGRRSCATASSDESEYRKENYPMNWKIGFGSETNGIEGTTPPPPSQTQPQAQSTPPSLSTTSIQTLTQQIRRLPSVFYLDSTNTESLETEQLLRKTYGLPLVAFYVDKIEKSKLVEKNLEQLTAYKQMPYLFICGTFIGSQEHINNYHKNKQIPQLVEYVCSEQRKLSKSEPNKRSKVRRKKKKPVT